MDRTMGKETVILEVTGKDLMEKLDDIHKELGDLTVQVKVTNGNVKTNRKMIYGLFSGLFVLAGWFVLHLISSIA